MAALVLLVVSRTRFANGQPQAQPLATSPRLEDVDERDGPFVVGGKSFTIVHHYKRLPGKNGPDAQALASLEVVGAGGTVEHHESFPYSIERGEFSESCSADVERLDGSNGKGFLIDSQCLPSAPLSGGPWKILGLVNGRLVPFAKPLTTEGEMGGFVPGAIRRIGTATQILPDTLNVRVWTGYFFATIPVRIDWSQGSLTMAQHCFYQTGHGFAEDGCEVPVQHVERLPADEDLTFVRLFAEPHEPGGIPAHVVVKRDASVDILAGKVFTTWDQGPDSVNLGVTDDLWLKVRIDGKEGWIHTVEDFSAIGLHPSG